ncbi:MAG: isochorismatase family protein [Acidimicrobiales bacterium]|nr:isochorismatase family protein [Acidimicrobiales bacterium]RZV41452.1 MAG: isochorismatase family protein [Acidimicrobiales bacterium]
MAESNSALLVIDVQNDVVVNAHRRDDVVGRIASLVARARAEDVPVIWVQHSDDELPADTPGWQIVPELPVAVGEPIIHKHHRDSFDGTSLATELERLGVDRLVITGSQTDFCVRWTLHGAQTRGYHTTLVTDAHTTDDGDADIPTAAQLIEHTNRYWRTQSHGGHTADTAAAVDVTF